GRRQSQSVKARGCGLQADFEQEEEILGTGILELEVRCPNGGARLMAAPVADSQDVPRCRRRSVVGELRGGGLLDAQAGQSSRGELQNVHQRFSLRLAISIPALEFLGERRYQLPPLGQVW